ncbi:phosphatase PAP2 family protein [Solilutibacter silvestris]|uniref:phosphatase PAP2 family protein n=1 Tax=Solilutibacter silvestris TaxID=1645665 RepID=UPI003D3520C2
MTSPRLRAWLPWILLAIAAVACTVPFWMSDLDIRAAAHFHHQAPFELGYDASWPMGNKQPYKALYAFGSALSWLIVLASILAFAVPRWRKHPLVRKMALTSLATVALGTGLLVNGIGKDYTGRPRPRTLQEFGGQAQYRPPLDLGTPGVGKSFPCGHCSVGFAVGAIGLTVMAARPTLGVAIIVGSFLLGGAIGSARMAAGAHFLSDVLWSGILTWAAALTSHALISGQRARAWVSRWPPWLGYALLGVLIVVVMAGLLFVRPFHKRIDVRMPLAADSSYVLKLESAALDVRVDPAQADAVHLQGEVKGVGFPNVRVREDDSSDATSRVHAIRHTGQAREIFAPMVLSVRPEAVPHLRVEIDRGSVRLIDPAALRAAQIHVQVEDAAE